MKNSYNLGYNDATEKYLEELILLHRMFVNEVLNLKKKLEELKKQEKKNEN